MVSRKLKYVNAGHFPPILKSGNQLIRLDHGCTFIGAFEKLESINEHEILLEAEAMIVCFTDGLPDLKNHNEEFFGDNILEEFVDMYHTLSPDDFNLKLIDEMNAFRGDMSIEDDIAVLTCKIY